MSKPKIIAAMTLTLALGATMVGALAGCSASQSASTQSTESSADAAQTREIVDVYGRTVEVPENVETCATVGSAVRFVVYAGAQDKLVAVTEMDAPSSPARPYTVAQADILGALPTTSNGNHLMETSVDGEALLSIDPDVIISSRSAQECDELQAQIGIPVVGISYQDQIFTYNVYGSILVVGETLGTEDHAQQVVDKMRGWQADLSDRTADIPEDDRPSCYAGAVNYKGAKSFGGTYMGYPPFEAVNIKNVADEDADGDEASSADSSASTGAPGNAKSGSIEVTLEQIGEWDPDFMFLNAGNMSLLQKDYDDNQAFFDSLTAFQNDNLYTQPSYNMNGTNVELAICDAYFDGATVYPQAFGDVDLIAKYSEIFEVMLGSDCYGQLAALGISFDRLSF